MECFSVIFRTEQDRDRAVMDCIFPDYISWEIQERIFAEHFIGHILTIPVQCLAYACQVQEFPAVYYRWREPTLA